MADDIASLGLFVDSSGVIRATKELRKLQGQSGKNEKANAKLTKSFGLLKTAATAVAASLVLKHFVSTAAAFETMKVSLETVTGSAEKANIAFEGIKDFASNTPFSVEEVTQSFIKLKALGIEPTEANLRSFGNTSSAMGKSLNQMIEAVADAATGEFERLKEFGIKASKEGDRATFTFKGVSTTIKNTSKDITGYLQTLGENEFGGAMKNQMDTVNGAFSNAGDAIDGLADALGDSGLNQVVKSVTLSFSALVNVATEFLRGDNSVSGLEKQIDAITESIFTLQSSLEIKQDNNFIEDLITGSAEDATEVIIKLEQQLATLQDKLKSAKSSAGVNGIDEGGKVDKVALEREQQEKLQSIAEEYMAKDAERLEVDKALKILSKQDEIDAIYEMTEASDLALLTTEAAATEKSKEEAAARVIEQKSALNDTLSGFAALTASSSKKAFKIGKAASLAQAVVGTATSAIESFKNAGGYPLGIPAAAGMVAAGALQIQKIKAQKFSGQAHDGMDFVKKTGSFQLKEGEMVVDSGTSQKVRDNLLEGTGKATSITFAPVIQAFDAEDIMKNKDALFNGLRDRFVRWMNEEGLSFAS